MTERQFLEQLTGERWTGLKFIEAVPAGTQRFARLCEAVHQSFGSDITIACGTMECPGALRSLGLGRPDEQMALQMSEKTGMPMQRAKALLSASPILKRNVRSIELGNADRPDILLSYLQPEAAMKLLRCWQQMTGRRLSTDLSAFTAVCASLVAAEQDDQPVFSFGCPDSREYGGIGPDRLVAALSRDTASQMMQEIEDHANV